MKYISLFSGIECARKAAEETLNSFPFKPYVDSPACHKCFLKVDDIAVIIERHMRAWLAAEGKNAHNVDTLSERAECLEQALTDAYAKLDEAKGILGKVL